MERVLRIDYGTVANVTETPQGGLRVDAAVTRVGVLRYRDTNGHEWSELRSPEEVFAADSIASLRSAPVTDGHPSGLVNTENYCALQKGHVSDSVRQDGDFVAAEMVVNDAATCARIRSGERKDVSAGYTCEVDPTPGVWRGERFDKQQRSIRYNHAAILPAGTGRAGAEVSLRMDGAAISVTRSDAAAHGAMTMKTITILGQTYRCDDDASMAKLGTDVGAMKAKSDEDASSQGDALASLQQKLQDALVQIITLTATIKAAEVAATAEESSEGDDGTVNAEEVLDSKKARRVIAGRLLGKVKLGGMRADAVRALVDSAVETRATVLAKVRTDAATVLGATVDLKGKSAGEIRAMTIAKVAPTVKLDSLNEVAVSATFDAVIAAFATREVRADGHDNLRRIDDAAGTAGGGDGKTLDQARADLQTETENRGRRPLIGS